MRWFYRRFLATNRSSPTVRSSYHFSSSSSDDDDRRIHDGAMVLLQTILVNKSTIYCVSTRYTVFLDYKPAPRYHRAGNEWSAVPAAHASGSWQRSALPAGWHCPVRVACSAGWHCPVRAPCSHPRCPFRGLLQTRPNFFGILSPHEEPRTTVAPFKPASGLLIYIFFYSASFFHTELKQDRGEEVVAASESTIFVCTVGKNVSSCCLLRRCFGQRWGGLLSLLRERQAGVVVRLPQRQHDLSLIMLSLREAHTQQKRAGSANSCSPGFLLLYLQVVVLTFGTTGEP